ncbi:probable E3 ubiquitin-protein ligase RHA4A [Impatiens glandulifera]|uniref:probable E3 ubiquitin-protein ligase RHA4A n=1 Tax=Impatiens glandulifera TaxID=253017 RepID=UPI001FB15678|nr:probable E3 ubiquitin-protein ligase RHA4A [Impatiens glandulifera]
MGYNSASSSSSSSSSAVELYPEEVQLKLYQAFIFSIPILIAIILLLLLYLFYLKRRTTTETHHLPISAHSNSNMAGERFMISSSSSSSSNLKLNHQVAKLQTVLLNQVLPTVTDSTCCVCLGEFELEDVLQQIPACRHVFHADCIRLWLISNTTCPLCRCFINSHPPHPPIYS